VKNLLKLFTNKYIITAVLFLLLMLFFDQNDWFTQHERQKELEKTQQKIDHVNGEISRMDQDLNDLHSSNAKLEQYAREKYHEKQDGEDVYIIVPDTVKAKSQN
jgi:cell division protein FtsB